MIIKDKRLTAEESIVKDCQKRSFDRKHVKKIEDLEGCMSACDLRQNSTSGIGDTLKCGQVRWFKDRFNKNGISRGKI